MFGAWHGTAAVSIKSYGSFLHNFCHPMVFTSANDKNYQNRKNQRGYFTGFFAGAYIINTWIMRGIFAKQVYI